MIMTATYIYYFHVLRAVPRVLHVSYTTIRLFSLHNIPMRVTYEKKKTQRRGTPSQIEGGKAMT